ncbi:MAG: hybrid sensor histidine kinase/response regulator [Gammaproteobacteria bacterium]|nr:hybrid sensor histidine kinase/response regulator [Gammaproteobacteria bacterium]
MNPLQGVENSTNTDYSLLVVDDNEMNRQLMSIQFKRAGYNVTLAEGGYEALEFIENHPFDLVLLDIMMPGISGLEVLQQVRVKHSLISLPIIMVTADDLEQSIITALKLGANDYLTKPLNIAIAMARIKTQLALKNLAALKDEFVRFASHDLKKPLIVMLDIASELKTQCHPGLPTNKDTPELIELIQRTGENMHAVIDGFLNLESTANTTPEPNYKSIKLNDIIAKSLHTNESYAKQKGIKIQKELSQNLPAIEADEFRLSQVIENLIGNAMKFSPRETTTTIRTRVDNEYVYAEISDGGPGLTEEDMDKLFTRYAKLSNHPTGNESSTGIGLSMSKQFIELHKGRIGARNNPNKGATFWFGIPINH